MKRRIHYHSDCAFFAGCENMLVNFWSSREIRERFDVSFSYRSSSRYDEGLARRVRLDFRTDPLRFPESSDVVPVPKSWPRILRGLLRLGSRLVFTVPLLVYEIWVIFGLLRRISPDVMHINNGGYPAALSARAAAIAGRLAGVPSIIMVVNNLATGYRHPLRWLEYPLDRIVALCVTQFVTGSRAAANRLQATLGLREDRYAAINNGIQLRSTTETIKQTRARLGLAGFDGVVFGIVALMEPRKGHRVLLAAMSKLRRDKPALARNARLLIEGDGPLRTELERYVVENDLSEHCSFVGIEANVMNLIAALDVLVLPSIDHEDFPNVVLEAMGSAKPVIASRLAGTPEQVVDGRTGYLVPPGDSDSLAAAMARFCADSTLQVRMGQNGFEQFKRYFTADVAVHQYVTLYSSLIGAQDK